MNPPPHQAKSTWCLLRPRNSNTSQAKQANEREPWPWRALQRAVAQLAKTNVDVLVTAPINKDTIRSAGFNFPGHTEYLASEAGVEDVLMLLCCDGLRIGMATGHVALKEVSTELTSAKIGTKLQAHERQFGSRLWHPFTTHCGAWA